MKKRNFILALVLFFTGMTGLAEVNNIVVERKNGTKADYPIDEVMSIKFGNSDLTVVKSDASGVTYAFDEVQKISFAIEEPGNVKAVPTASEMTVWVARDGSMLRVNNWNSDKPARVAIYSLQGVRVIASNEWNGADIDISSLVSGIYVIQVDGKTAKFRK